MPFTLGQVSTISPIKKKQPPKQACPVLLGGPHRKGYPPAQARVKEGKREAGQKHKIRIICLQQNNKNKHKQNKQKKILWLLNGEGKWRVRACVCYIFPLLQKLNPTGSGIWLTKLEGAEAGGQGWAQE